jgi:hypothetical protein
MIVLNVSYNYIKLRNIYGTTDYIELKIMYTKCGIY